jgi:hypothetical protein
MYSYLDGSGNKYNIIKNEIEYIPVKPGLSSSGTYDGGEYLKFEITEDDYEKVIAVLNNAINNKGIHIENRVMMSGMIIVKESNDVKSKIIIAPKSDIKAEIENLLYSLVNE